MLELITVGIGVSCTSFALVWAICVRIRNYGFLDAVWSLSIAFLAPIYAFFGFGSPLRRAAFTAVGVAWSLRLGSYVLGRVKHAHPHEDERYRTLRERWPGKIRFLLFFELQALIAVVFSLPFALAALDPVPGLRGLEVFGLAVALAATVGEAIADRQAQSFKRAYAGRGVINVGLWRYSRHPNYFFESMVWWGFSIASLEFRHGWITLACPLLMLYFLLRVTGIPLTEAHSLETRGAAYREYQRTTSAFIPWFRKNPSRSADE